MYRKLVYENNNIFLGAKKRFWNLKLKISRLLIGWQHYPEESIKNTTIKVLLIMAKSFTWGGWLFVWSLYIVFPSSFFG